MNGSLRPMSEDPRRQLFHDLRGVIAAAHANVEYLREQGVSQELEPVCAEIAHELQLVADVIAQLGARDPDRRVELDLRAQLWLLARSGARVRIDPTAPPFVVRGTMVMLGALVDAIASAVAPGAHATLSVSSPQDSGQATTCAVDGLERGRAHETVVAIAAQLGLSPTVEGGRLILRASID
jgi:hypothetical protein